MRAVSYHPILAAVHDIGSTLRANASARHRVHATKVSAVRVLLRSLDQQRRDALTRDDMPAVARCEDRIVGYELALAESEAVQAA